MKSKLLFLSILFLLITAVNYSQSSAEQAGIAVQGIARNNNNTAKANSSITLVFTLYYKDQNNNNVNIGSPITANLTTDAFGVFSYVIDPSAVNSSALANNQAWLKIEEGDITISDEKLKHVPYAIAANNGVPTGSIMPFMGDTAPTGWVLCNGQSLSGVPGSNNLRTLVGNNAPDLRGMFLRGTGVSPVNNQSGPTLGQTQNEATKEHSHNAGALDIGSGTGQHTHNSGSIWLDKSYADGDDGGSYNLTNGGNSGEGAYVVNMSGGGHDHEITGSTASFGGNETRPVNYGVNYIIKL